MAKWLPAWLGVVALVSTVSAVSTVHAAPAAKVAALIPQLRPTPTNELRDRFHDAVSRGLQGAAEVVNAAEVRMRLGLSPDMATCAGSSVCVGKIASVLRVDGVIATDIVTAGKRYFIRVQLLDATGREISRAEETCEICTLKEADDAAARASAQLQIAALVKITPAPTPVAKPEPKPEPVVVKPEPKPEPVAKPEPKPEPAPRNDPSLTTTQTSTGINPALRYAAIGTAVFVVVGVIIGGVLVGIDGNPTCDKPNGMFTCERVYSTVGGGGTMLALGIASLAASGTLFYFDYKQRKKPAPLRASLFAGPGGGMLSVGGTY